MNRRLPDPSSRGFREEERRLDRLTSRSPSRSLERSSRSQRSPSRSLNLDSRSQRSPARSSGLGSTSLSSSSRSLCSDSRMKQSYPRFCEIDSWSASRSLGADLRSQRSPSRSSGLGSGSWSGSGSVCESESRSSSRNSELLRSEGNFRRKYPNAVAQNDRRTSVLSKSQDSGLCLDPDTQRILDALPLPEKYLQRSSRNEGSEDGEGKDKDNEGTDDEGRSQGGDSRLIPDTDSDFSSEDRSLYLGQNEEDHFFKGKTFKRIVKEDNSDIKSQRCYLRLMRHFRFFLGSLVADFRKSGINFPNTKIGTAKGYFCSKYSLGLR